MHALKLDWQAHFFSGVKLNISTSVGSEPGLCMGWTVLQHWGLIQGHEPNKHMLGDPSTTKLQL